MQDEDDEAYLRRFDDEVAGATAEDGDGAAVQDEADYPDSDEDDSVGDYSDEDDDDERLDSEHDCGGFRNEADFGREDYYRFEGGQSRESCTSNPAARETVRGGSRADDEQQQAAELTNTTSPCS